MFARFGEGKKLVSGGNDGRVLIWEWAKSWDVDPNPFDESGESKGKPEDSNEVETIDHGEKVRTDRFLMSQVLHLVSHAEVLSRFPYEAIEVSMDSVNMFPCPEGDVNVPG